jgi:hypothetical protein
MTSQGCRTNADRAHHSHNPHNHLRPTTPSMRRPVRVKRVFRNQISRLKLRTASSLVSREMTRLRCPKRDLSTEDQDLCAVAAPVALVGLPVSSPESVSSIHWDRV